MLRNLPFAYKITLLPAMAGIAFALILGTAWHNAQRSSEVLAEIETGYYSSLELSRELYKGLGLIHRSFQDAAATADLEVLGEAAMLRDTFMDNLSAGRSIPVIDHVRIDSIEGKFIEYYELASTTTRALIDETGGPEVFDNLQKVAQQVATLQAVLAEATEADKAAVTAAFSSARTSQSRSNKFMVVVAAVSVLLLALTSILIIRMMSEAMRTAVRGMTALAEGDLTRQIKSDSADEIGQMVRSVDDVTGTVNELAGEVYTLIEAVRAGRLDVRGNSRHFHGAYAELVDNINELIDAFVAPIGITADYVERISQGDIPPEITETYEGDFNRIKGNLNALVGSLNGLVQQVAMVTDAAREGRLTQRADAARFSGVWGELVGGVNETLEAVAEPIYEVSSVMSNLANGDLTRKITANYAGDFAKLKNDVNVTVETLTEVISSIKGSSASVSGAAADIAKGNQSLRVRSEAQVSSLKETAASMNDMTATVQQNADNATQANDLAIHAREKARQGGDVVSTMVSAMTAINESSGKISDIISVIDEIAFQTNLLALNAAVEAARAGEQGRGFAVVASEVRVLAGRSATAAKEIASLIRDSVDKVHEGSRLVQESGDTLEEIIDAVGNVTEVVSAIATASNEQTRNIKGVNRSIGEMENMTLQNAAMVEQATESSLTMGDEARQLNEMMDFFTVEQNEIQVYGDDVEQKIA